MFIRKSKHERIVSDLKHHYEHKMWQLEMRIKGLQGDVERLKLQINGKQRDIIRAASQKAPVKYSNTVVSVGDNSWKNASPSSYRSSDYDSGYSFSSYDSGSSCSSDSGSSSGSCD